MTDFRQRIQHPDLKALYDYWIERRRGRRWPSRADINPLELKFILGNLTLIDVHYQPLRFTFRLSGTLFSQRMGMDFTGKSVDDIPDPAYRAEVSKVYRRMVETGEPSVAISERVIEDQPRKFEILRLPLSDDGTTINMLLICPLYFQRPPSNPGLGPAEQKFTAPRTIKNE